MNLAHLLLRTARVFPERPAVAVGDRDLYDYRELARRVCILSANLRSRFGLAAGERVALYLQNCAEYLELLYAVWHAGLVAVPINHKLHPREAAYILDDAEAALVFVSDDTESGELQKATGRTIVAVDSADYRRLLAGEGNGAEPYDNPDLAWLFYTSGTTGKPKGVMLSHDNLLAMTLCYFSDVDKASRDDTVLYAAPMSHGAGLYNLPHVLVGARHLIPASRGFQADEMFELAGRYRNLSLFAAPTMMRRLVDHAARHGGDPAGFKSVVYGGGPMYVEDIRRGLAVMGERFIQIYGQGESPMTITALSKHHIGNVGHPRYLERLGSVGLAQAGVEVGVVDIDGNPLPPGQGGEIVVRGRTVMNGYWNNPPASLAVFRGGWLHTGDVGVFDADGFLTLKDRSKDVIISGGSNIYPREVEEVLLCHPAVSEVSVVGRVNAEWGEEVVAFVVCEEGKSVVAAELDQVCLAQMARFKRPKEYRIVAALPKNNYGKVLKTELRKILAAEK